VGLRFNPPPNWPPPPPGFVPPPRWQPDPSWPPPPPGWQVWVDDPLPGELDDFADGAGEDGYPGGFADGGADYIDGTGGFARSSGGFADSSGGFADGAPPISGQSALDYLDGSYTPPDAPSPPSGQPNGFAIAAFVLGAIGGTILSAVLAVIALRQIRDTGQRGKWLAIAGLAFSVIWGAALAGYLLLYNPGPSGQQPAAVGTSSSSAGSSPSASNTGSSGGTASPGGKSKQAANVFTLRAGDCFQNPPGNQSVLGITYVTVVPCTTAHNAQVFVAFSAVGTKYPGAAALKHQADRGCHARLGGLLVNSRITSTMSLRFFYPLESSWSSGHRTISCLIVDTTPDLKSSLLRTPPAH
jgi:hypothetical protein